MIADAQRPDRPFGIIVVYDVKRFGRVGNDEAGYYRHLLRQHGVEVRYVSENFSGDGSDDLLRPVKQWQARQESKDLSKVTIRGLVSKFDSKEGWWMGGTPPYGYDLRYETLEGRFLFVLRYMPDGTKQQLDEQGVLSRTLARGESLSVSKRDRAKLVASEPQRVQVIRRIFKMYAEEGKGFKAIADTLNREGVPTARGEAWARIYSGKWTDTTIRPLLVNPLYVGDMVWNRRTDARFYRIEEGRAVEREDIHGARLVPNDESAWVVVRDTHEPLVERRVFEQARQVRESRPTSIEQRGLDPRLKVPCRGEGGGHGRTWRGQRSRFILSGLLTCARCGNRYQGYTRVKGERRADGTAVKTFAYGCGGYITKGKSICELGPVPQETLEAAVIEAVLAFYRPYLEPGGKRRLAEAVRAQVGGEGQEIEAARERVEKELKGTKGIIANLLDNITPANREFVDERLTDLQKRRTELQARLEELDGLALSQVKVEKVVEEAQRFVRELEFVLRQGVPEEKLVALRRCVERVWVAESEEGARLAVYRAPAGNLRATEELSVAPYRLGAAAEHEAVHGHERAART